MQTHCIWIPKLASCKNTRIYAIFIANHAWRRLQIHLDSRKGNHLCNKLQNIIVSCELMSKYIHNMVNHTHILWIEYSPSRTHNLKPKYFFSNWIVLAYCLSLYMLLHGMKSYKIISPYTCIYIQKLCVWVFQLALVISKRCLLWEKVCF